MTTVNKAVKLVLTAVIACGCAGATTFDFTREDIETENLPKYFEKLGITVTGYFAPDAKSTLQPGFMVQSKETGLGITPDLKSETLPAFQFLLFRFSAPTDLATLGIGNFDAENKLVNRDFTYYSSDAKELGELGSVSELEKLFSAPTSVLCMEKCGELSEIAGKQVTMLLVGAEGSTEKEQTVISLRIQSLSVASDELPMPQDTAAPEPSSITAWAH